jgi:hypothetical protein
MANFDVCIYTAERSFLPIGASDASLQQMCLLAVMKHAILALSVKYYWPGSLVAVYQNPGHGEQSYKRFWMTIPVTLSNPILHHQ